MRKRPLDLSPGASVRLGESLAYGVGGGFATNAINLFATTFAIVFYTEVMHVNPATATSVVGVSKILDGLSDLIAGRVIDNTKPGKFGKARIWLLRMIPFTVVAMLAMYLMPRNLSGFGQIAYMFITYNLLSTVCYTFTYVAHSTLNGLMTRDQKSRGTNGGVFMIGNVIASLLGNATIITGVKLLSKNPEFSNYGDQTGWLRLVGIWMVLMCIAQLVIVFGTFERVTVAEEPNEKQLKEKNIPLSLSLKALFTNKYWIYNIIIGICINVLLASANAATSYFMTYVLGDAEFYELYSTIYGLSMLAALFVGFIILAKAGKRNTVIIGMVICAASTLLPLIRVTKSIMIVSAVLSGIGYGIAGCAFASVIQDTLTYGEWKNGFSMVGIGNAANSFCAKIGNSLGTIVLGAIMSATGFVSGALVQSESAIGGLKIVYIWLPFLFSLITMVAAFLYNLDKIYPQVEADLAEGKYAPGVVPYHER